MTHQYYTTTVFMSLQLCQYCLFCLQTAIYDHGNNSEKIEVINAGHGGYYTVSTEILAFKDR